MKYNQVTNNILIIVLSFVNRLKICLMNGQKDSHQDVGI